MNAIPCTVGILTRNSGATLRRALESVRDFAEIIVCDGRSIDDTLAIARQFNARVIEQRPEFLDADGRLFDYGGARNQTLDAAAHEWFFFIDSDEYAGADLVVSIRTIIAMRKKGAFWVNRKYVREGTVIDHATTYPNRQMRLFHRSSVTRFIKKMHERIELRGGVVAEYCPGTLYVPFDFSPQKLREKWTYQIDVEMKRLGSISLFRFVKAVFEYAKVSALYSVRLIRNAFQSGTHMPFALEMERHIHHLRLIRALWTITRWV